MKKALVVLLVLACVGAAAFADGTPKWSVSSLWGFGLYMPSSGNELLGYDYSNVGLSRTRLGFTYTAADGNVGFNSRLQMTIQDYTALTNTKGQGAIFNQLNGWAKLFGGMLTVRAGVLDDYTIASSSDWMCFGNTDGKTGVYFDVAPIAGLDIGLFQVIPANGTPVAATMNGDIVGLAYALPNLVTVSGGAVLDNSNTATAGNNVYFGVQLKAVPNLTAIVEGQISLYNGSTPMQFAENVGYAMGALTVGVRAGEYITSAETDWGFEPSVAYKVNDNVAVNVIANIYSAKSGIGNITFMSPLDAGVVGNLLDGSVQFGGGGFVTWTEGGFVLTVGDYYSAATGAGNLFFINADVSL